ncbi:class I SAM-dependent methyltransferase [Desertimonas flava]|uniref:class I SAM-dependent methyltransferase n=1 Tax=Desertimonas flava TaxID=2064846 RepID=UPI000E354DEF|nr:methyltransferase domain-containing protein [Desertimonas flava]
MSSVPRTGYVFRTAEDAERDRLDAHRELWDAFTFRRLAATGITAGWHCLEIGAGTGSVAMWLADRVGTTGLVVATDVETRWLDAGDSTNIVVRHHNVTADPLDEEGFDLVHARLVLEHLPDRPAVVAKLVAALRPGGFLVVEDYDVRPMALIDRPDDDWVDVHAAAVEVLRRRGTDLRCGQALPALLRHAGLDAVTAEGLVHPMTIPALAPVFRPALEQVAPLILQSGAVTQVQLDHVLSMFDELDHPAVSYTPALVSVTGRRRVASPLPAGP